jgi:hypothetical protein
MSIPHSKLPADVGGEEAGPVETIDHGMKFWERQANALRSTLSRARVVKTDELRRAAEDLGENYARLEYFEKTTTALRTILIEKGYFTSQELEARMAEIRARFDVPPKVDAPVRKGTKE